MLTAAQILFNVFGYLNAIDRVRVGRVCSDWHRILQDEALKTPAVEIIELVNKVRSAASCPRGRATLLTPTRTLTFFFAILTLTLTLLLCNPKPHSP